MQLGRMRKAYNRQEDKDKYDEYGYWFHSNLNWFDFIGYLPVNILDLRLVCQSVCGDSRLRPDFYESDKHADKIENQCQRQTKGRKSENHPKLYFERSMIGIPL